MTRDEKAEKLDDLRSEQRRLSSGGRWMEAEKLTKEIQELDLALHGNGPIVDGSSRIV